MRVFLLKNVLSNITKNMIMRNIYLISTLLVDVLYETVQESLVLAVTSTPSPDTPSPILIFSASEADCQLACFC